MGDRDFTKTSWNYDGDRSLSCPFADQRRQHKSKSSKQNLEIEHLTVVAAVHFASGKLLAKEQSQVFENSMDRF